MYSHLLILQTQGNARYLQVGLILTGSQSSSLQHIVSLRQFQTIGQSVYGLTSVVLLTVVRVVNPALHEGLAEVGHVTRGVDMQSGVSGATIEHIPTIHRAHAAIGDDVSGVSIAGVLHTEGALSHLQIFQSSVNKGNTTLSVLSIVGSSLGQLTLGSVDGLLEVSHTFGHYTLGNQSLSIGDGSLQVGIVLVVVIEDLQSFVQLLLGNSEFVQGTSLYESCGLVDGSLQLVAIERCILAGQSFSGSNQYSSSSLFQGCQLLSINDAVVIIGVTNII